MGDHTGGGTTHCTPSPLGGQKNNYITIRIIIISPKIPGWMTEKTHFGRPWPGCHPGGGRPCQSPAAGEAGHHRVRHPQRWGRTTKQKWANNSSCGVSCTRQTTGGRGRFTISQNPPAALSWHYSESLCTCARARARVVCA